MTVFDVMEMGGTLSFAISGSIAGIRKRLDPFGILIIGFVSSIGGGTIRDILLGSFPVAWMLDMRSVSLIFIGIIITLLFYKRVLGLNRGIFWFDTFGLALFCSAAIQKGLNFHVNYPIIIALGTITGCFGGVLRDVLLNEIPMVFRKDIYASACIAGGIVYLGLFEVGLSHKFCQFGTLFTIVIIRVGAVYWNWNLPMIYKKAK
jgi:uncharacterized membrane protein YeiH